MTPASAAIVGARSIFNTAWLSSTVPGTAPEQMAQAVLADEAGWDGVFVWEAAYGVDAWTLLAAMAQRWADEGWPARVDDTGTALTAEYSAPSAGPPPWFVYRLTARRATALSTVEPGGATRWTF